jgi:hypothetical protein
LERDSGISAERKMIRQRLVNLIFIIGGVLVVITSLLRSDIQARLGFSSTNNIGIYNVLAYFLLGLIVLSLTQFSILRARWGLDKIPVHRNLVTRWIVFTFIFLMGLIAVAAVLPTGYTLNFLSVLRQLASFLGILFGIIIAILSLPLVLIAALLSWLFGGGTNIEAGQQVQQLPVAPPATPQSSWLEFIKSLLFWVVFFGAIGFSIYYYIQVNKMHLSRLSHYPIIQKIITFWNWIREQVMGINRAVITAVESGVRRFRSIDRGLPKPKSWEFISRRNLTSRQRVMLFYMMMLRRGEKSGIARAGGETPYEYARMLSSRISAQESEEGPVVDVDMITEKFIEARYSTHIIDKQSASTVRLAWERIQRVLRQIRTMRN